MSFSIKLNKSNNISFRVNPSSSSIAFTLTLPRITLSLRVKRKKKKSISKSHDMGTSYKPVTSVDISSLKTKEYKPYINKISRLIKLNTLSNFLIPCLLLSLLTSFISGLLEPKGIIYTILNKSLILIGFSISLKVIITFFFIFIGVIGIILKVYVHSIARFQYNLLSSHNNIPTTWSKLAGSDILWQVVGICELDDNASKKNAGISTIYERIEVELRYKTPYYIRTKSKVLQLKLDDYTLVVLPGHYIIVDKYKVAVIETGDLVISSEDIKYAETESLPGDAEVLSKTWKYVNKDGSKDKRYKDNEEIPVCNYKLVRIEGGSGFKLLFLSSAV